MYQVNLLPWRIRQQRRRYAFWLRFFCGQLVIALATLFLISNLLSYQQGQQHRVLQQLTQQHLELTERLQQTQQRVAELARQVAIEVRYQRNGAHNRRYLSLLQQLSRALPEGVWLTAFEEDAQGISLRGLGGHYVAITALEQRLAAFPQLQDSRLAEVLRRKEGELVFILTARWGQDG